MIKAIMRRVAQGSVAILVAHRLSSVQQCDLILVLRDGNIGTWAGNSACIQYTVPHAPYALRLLSDCGIITALAGDDTHYR